MSNETEINNINPNYVFYKVIVREIYCSPDKVINVLFYKIMKKIDKNHKQKMNIYDYLVKNNMIKPQLRYHNSYYCELSEEEMSNNYNLSDYNIEIMHICELNDDKYIYEDDVLEHDHITFI